MKEVAILVFRVFDVLLFPLTIISSIWMKGIRTANMKNMPISKLIFSKIGVLPLRDQYSDPLINPQKHLRFPLNQDRENLSIDFNLQNQLILLGEFQYQGELTKFPLQESNLNKEYYYLNPFFPCGDSEYLYSIIRHYVPQRIIEIGCGNSTLMIRNAVAKNMLENSNYFCEHDCIEPYNQPWLEELEVNVLRQRVEEINLQYFQKLKRNDILFIDSSHVIRPQGDVLYEILEILPKLNTGVIVHIHDIYTPKDYPDEFVLNEMRLWNEQYLLEALLSKSKDFEVIGALNYLSNHHEDGFAEKFPIWRNHRSIKPTSFWISKT